MNLDVIRRVDRIHPYPAKFTVDLAIKYISKYTNYGDTVYDPFVGSGTSLLAASVLRRRGYGTDINHIAILIAKAKQMRLFDDEIVTLHDFIERFEKSYKEEINKIEPYYYPSIEHWFCENSIAVLSYILFEKNFLNTENEKLFLDLAMSSIINTVSNQEGDTRYAAIEKPDLTIERIGTVFINKYRALLELFVEFNSVERIENKPMLLDAKLCNDIIQSESVDLIITSPPYVNTYDYYLYHKHRMNWLGYDVKYSMESEIGSRREFSSLKHTEEKFSNDLFTILSACNNTLKPNGKVVIIMGDGKVAGKIYDAKENMTRICALLGWKLIDYSYSNLDDTSRSFQKSYRTKGKKEYIMVFNKAVKK